MINRRQPAQRWVNFSSNSMEMHLDGSLGKRLRIEGSISLLVYRAVVDSQGLLKETRPN